MLAQAPLLEMIDVSVSYRTRAGVVPAVTGVSLVIHEGEALGLVGESGCGKSTLGMASLGYFGGNGRLTGGSIRFAGQDIAGLTQRELRRIRGPGIGIVYQEAMSALNPSIRVGVQLAEVAVTHRGLSRQQARHAACGMLAEMQVTDPERIMAAYPHQLSGGQQQRAVIAMALLPQPRLLLLDEPTTSLDVTIEAGIVDLLMKLRRNHNTAMLFISHNLGLVGQICDRAAVMYAGEIVETGEVERMFAQPRHPYTMGLVRCIPRPDLPRAAQRLVPIPGQVSAPGERPIGCRFGPRCEHFRRRFCDQAAISLDTIDPASAVRCVRSATIAALPILGGVDGVTSPRDKILLEVADLDKFYTLRGPAKGHVVRANQGLTFEAARGQTLAIVESGCGKSTFANVLMGLTAASGGRLRFETVELAQLPLDRRPATLLRDLQMVFQNPDETLDPKLCRRHADRACGTQARHCARSCWRAGAGEQSAEHDPLARFLCRPPAEPVVGGTEAACRHRARPGGRTEAGRRRRTGICSRCVGAGGHHRTVARYPADAADHIDYHQP